MADSQRVVNIVQPVGAVIGFFERYLSVWVVLCIFSGVFLGKFFMPLFQAMAAVEYAHVNLLVALLMWMMIIPMVIKIDFGAMQQVKDQSRGIGVTIFVNWFIKPFSMALLGGDLCLPRLYAMAAGRPAR